jgi:hypothetical protein
VSEPIWIAVASAREGLDLVEVLKRCGLRAVLVAGPAGCKVRVLERLRTATPLEAA